MSWALSMGVGASSGNFRRDWSPLGRSDRLLQLSTSAYDSGPRTLLFTVERVEQACPFARDGRRAERSEGEWRAFVDFLMQYRCLFYRSLRAFRDDLSASAVVPSGSTGGPGPAYRNSARCRSHSGRRSAWLPERRVYATGPHPGEGRFLHVRRTSLEGHWFHAAG